MAIATSRQAQPSIITVSVADASLVRDIKKAISLMKGVTKVSSPRKKRRTSLEQSELDIKAGRVTEYASVDDFFKSLGV